MRIGINVLWVRPGKNGGTESYIRNILDGLTWYAPRDDKFYLYVSKDNVASFDHYFNREPFEKRICNVNTCSQSRRVIWENTHLSKMGMKDHLDIWFMPVYSRPFFMSKKIPVVTVIHDLQAFHYPEYFSRGRNLFFRLSWWWDCRTSAKIVTISEFCKKDILSHYPMPEERIQVIYNPIITEPSEYDFRILSEKFGIRKKDYYYTVSSLAKHKNLITLLKAVKKLAEMGEGRKLLISGVKVNGENEILRYVEENHLEELVVFTGFISNEERDCLYDNCKVFLFPSVFEGFGMPPIEAMRRGAPVVTTREASIYEVTQGKAEYVENPFDEKEWAALISSVRTAKYEKYDFECYGIKNIMKQYIELFKKRKDGIGQIDEPG